MKTIHLTVKENELEKVMTILKSLKDELIDKLTVSENYTYVDDLGDTIEVINGEEFVVPTKKDLKAREEAIENLKNGETFSMEDIIKERNLECHIK